MCVKLSLAEFDDDMEVVAILHEFLMSSGLDRGSREGAQAYKLDEALEWIEWAEMVDLTMSNLTGPEAPHYFRICLRSQLGFGGPHGDGQSEISACHIAEDRGYQPRPDDVVMVVKDRMASPKVSQIVLMFPEAARPALGLVDMQPTGSHARRPASESDRKKVFDAATAAWQAGAISPKACDYLTQWATGTRRRLPRPQQYRFLMRRPCQLPSASLMPTHCTRPQSAPRPVLVASVGTREALPLEGGMEEEKDEGPLTIS